MAPPQVPLEAYDPALAEAARPGDADDEIAVIGRLSQADGLPAGVRNFGFDVAPPDFLKPDGTTRFLGLGDQRDDPASGPGNRWGYGRIVTPAEINDALRSANPYQTLRYDPSDADERGESGWTGA